MKIFAVIMAGGVGSRFWPRSKEKTPKQLLKIFGENTMIQDTVKRLEGLVENENIFVVTNKVQRSEIVKQLSQLPEGNIIAEPFGRNTAPCVGLASVVVSSKCKDGVIITLPADHIILDKEKFQQALKRAAEFAYKSEGLVTFGIMPTRPETGYGYIQIEESPVDEEIYKVITFAEKPNYSTAVRFIESGDFMWNSGMFIWRADAIIGELRIHMPDLYEGLEQLKNDIDSPYFEKTLTQIYGQLRSISIDYGVMEKSNKVYLTKGVFDWSDVGSWEEVYQLSEKDANGNAITGSVFSEQTHDSYIYSPDSFTAVIGVENLVVINTGTATLICRRDRAQEVKKIVDFLKVQKMNEHL